MDCWNDRSSSVPSCELDVFSLIVSAVRCYFSIPCYHKVIGSGGVLEGITVSEKGS